MSLTGFLILLAIAAVTGFIGQSLSGYSFGGCFIAIIIGFVGAYLGTWIAGKMGFPLFWVINVQGQTFPLVWAIIGSGVFSFLLGLILGKRKEN